LRKLNKFRREGKTEIDRNGKAREIFSKEKKRKNEKRLRQERKKKEVKGKEGKEKGGKGTNKYGNWRKEKTGREN
jgi:hypothetical protein